MYLWKCWRDARLAVVIFLVPTLVEIWSLVEMVVKRPMHMSNDGAVLPFAWFALTALGATMPLAAWILGGNGVGHSLAEDQGAFLLSRPRTRRFFLWSDAGYSFALFGLMALSNLLNCWICSLIPFFRVPVIPVGFAILHLLGGLLFLGLIYSVTYLCSIAAPRYGRVLSVIVLVAYAYLHHKSHAWGGLATYLFPTWWLQPYLNPASGILTPHFWLHLGGRVIAILVLLLIAQIALERREIRA